MKCENCQIEMQKTEIKNLDSHNIIIFYKCPKCNSQKNRMANILDGE